MAILELLGRTASHRCLIEFKDSDAIGMNGFENGVNGQFSIFVEDREIHFDPRCGVGSALAGDGEGLASLTLSTVLR
jgi:hypothetical protein